MPWLLIWNFIKDNWKLVLGVTLIAALVGYVWFLNVRLDHWKGVAQERTAELALAKKKQADLEADFATITKKYESALVETKETVEKNAKLIEEAIQHDKELNILRVSYNAVGLFNASKRDPSRPAPKAIQGNDGKAGTADPSGTTNGLKRTVPLSEIFSLVAKNDANHWKCVKQVESWQAFWIEFEAAVAAADRGVQNGTP